jgi:tRNA (guanine26-N2/guanine27-N2)-dimethyltransferase
MVSVLHTDTAIGKDIEVAHTDCKTLLTQKDGTGRCQWEIVDLDPFGSSIPYLASAIEGTRHKGIIGATFTDLKVIEGPDFKKLYSLYGAMRTHNHLCKEDISLRLVLASINREANKVERTIRPLLSVWKNFYLRVGCNY